jgi:hypothetical protein
VKQMPHCPMTPVAELRIHRHTGQTHSVSDSARFSADSSVGHARPERSSAVDCPAR